LAKNGFTIMEVMLFLALTGLVFTGVITGTNGNLARERYRDSVQGVATQLKMIYSSVENVEIVSHDDNICDNVGGTEHGSTVIKRGRSSCAVYGKLVSIYTDDNNVSHIQSATVYGFDYYDMVEDVQVNKRTKKNVCDQLGTFPSVFTSNEYSLWGHDCISSSNGSDPADLDTLNDLDLYKVLRADFGVMGARGEFAKGFELEDYTPEWGAKIIKKISGGDKKDLRAQLLILRSPRTGVIHTYVFEPETAAGENMVGDLDAASGRDDLKNLGVQGKLINPAVNAGTTFVKKDFRMCIDPSQQTSTYGEAYRMIKVIKDAHNGSGVELVNFDTVSSEDDKCQ